MCKYLNPDISCKQTYVKTIWIQIKVKTSFCLSTVPPLKKYWHQIYLNIVIILYCCQGLAKTWQAAKEML